MPDEKILRGCRKHTTSEMSITNNAQGMQKMRRLTTKVIERHNDEVIVSSLTEVLMGTLRSTRCHSIFHTRGDEINPA